VQRSDGVAYWNMPINSILEILNEKDNLVTCHKKFIKDLICYGERIEEMILKDLTKEKN
jgi:hypothetical protein